MNINTSNSPVDQIQTTLDFSSHSQKAGLQTPLWLCIHFRNIAAHCLDLISKSPQPTVIHQTNNNLKRIYYASNSAVELGITTNMNFLEAQNLYPNLKAYPKNILQEKRLIRSIAKEILQFSPMVSVKYDSSILIKSQHTTNSKHELVKLKNTISHYLDSLGLAYSMAASPVPIASLLLAKAKKTLIVCNNDDLRNVLNSLDVNDFLIDQGNLLELQKLGIQCGAQLFCLPTLSNSKLVGRSLYTYMNQLLGVANMKITPMQSSFSPMPNIH